MDNLLLRLLRIHLLVYLGRVESHEVLRHEAHTSVASSRPHFHNQAEDLVAARVEQILELGDAQVLQQHLEGPADFLVLAIILRQHLRQVLNEVTAVHEQLLEELHGVGRQSWVH